MITLSLCDAGPWQVSVIEQGLKATSSMMNPVVVYYWVINPVLAAKTAVMPTTTWSETDVEIDKRKMFC